MTQTQERPQTDTTDDVDSLARDYILSLKKGVKPDQRPYSEKWDDIIFKLERVFKDNGVVACQRLCDKFSFINPELKELLTLPPSMEDIVIEDTDSAFIDLPDSRKYPKELAASACLWLDNYIAFSKKWSPRGHARYHEPIGIALLSTVAGRRVGYQFGPQMQYTNFYIALLGDSTFLRKSTTARIYQNVLRAAKLDWLFGSDVVTPQKLISNMAGQHVPANYGQLEVEDQEILKKRLAMSGQVGWFYDEFGMHLDQMMKEGGAMGDFKGLLRKLDDSQEKHGSDTISRSAEVIKKPYLSLLASMTPSDIRPHAGKDNKFWKDGFFARFCFVCAPKGEKIGRARFPDEQIDYPASLIDPLKAWSDELGYPIIDIIPETNKAGTDIIGWSIEHQQDLPEQRCVVPPLILDAMYDYEGALLDMVEANKIPEPLYPNYGRLHVLSLRVAILLASFDNGGKIELRHWARAQQFAEDRRRDLHELYARVNSEEAYVSEASKLEDKILKVMHSLRAQGHTSVTASVLHYNWMKNLSTEEITKALEGMVKVGLLEKETTKSAKKGKYSLA